MTKTTTLPACLTRTQADDRAEALDWSRYRTGPAPGETWPVDGTAFNAALSAIQRREAEAVYAATERDDLEGESSGSVGHAAWQAACSAFNATHDEARDCGPALALAQRADLLDCARKLVALALEVAGC